MLKLKLQSFGYLMRRVDSLEKTVILGGIGGKRRRGGGQAPQGGPTKARPARGSCHCPLDLLLIATGGSNPLLCLEGFHDLRGTPQDEAGLTRKFETSHVGGAMSDSV